MKNKLFVGNVSWNATEDQLKTFFEQVGEVTEAKIIYDRATNRSKGIAFVTMATDELATQALEELNEKELDGRTIHIDYAKPRKERF